jgi:hypothetical protein
VAKKRMVSFFMRIHVLWFPVFYVLVNVVVFVLYRFFQVNPSAGYAVGWHHPKRIFYAPAAVEANRLL